MTGFVEAARPGQGRPRLGADPLAQLEVQQLLLHQEGMELHLVHRGRHGGALRQLLEVVDQEVAHPDGAHLALGQQLLQGLARFP